MFDQYSSYTQSITAADITPVPLPTAEQRQSFCARLQVWAAQAAKDAEDFDADSVEQMEVAIVKTLYAILQSWDHMKDRAHSVTGSRCGWLMAYDLHIVRLCLFSSKKRERFRRGRSGVRGRTVDNVAETEGQSYLLYKHVMAMLGVLYDYHVIAEKKQLCDPVNVAHSFHCFDDGLPEHVFYAIHFNAAHHLSMQCMAR